MLADSAIPVSDGTSHLRQSETPRQSRTMNPTQLGKWHFEARLNAHDTPSAARSRDGECRRFDYAAGCNPAAS